MRPCLRVRKNVAEREERGSPSDRERPETVRGQNPYSLRTKVVNADLLSLTLGLGGNDVIIGGRGRDVVCGYGGQDSLIGLEDDDTMFGGPGDDGVFGTGDND